MGITQTTVQILLVTFSSTMLSPDHDLPLLSSSMDHIKHCCKCRIDPCPLVLGIFMQNGQSSFNSNSFSIHHHFPCAKGFALCPPVMTPLILRLLGSNLVLIIMKTRPAPAIIVHDIPFPLHDSNHFTLSSWPGNIFHFLWITDREPFQSTTQGIFLGC